MVPGAIPNRPPIELRARRSQNDAFVLAQHAIIGNYVGSKIGNSRVPGKRHILPAVPEEALVVKRAWTGIAGFLFLIFRAWFLGARRKALGACCRSRRGGRGGQGRPVRAARRGSLDGPGV